MAILKLSINFPCSSDMLKIKDKACKALYGVNFTILEGMSSMPQLNFGLMVVMMLCNSCGVVGLRNIDVTFDFVE